MSQQQQLPDLDQLPPLSLLTYRQVALATGLSLSSIKRWAGAGRGPKMTRVEGVPRFKVRDVKLWLENDNG